MARLISSFAIGLVSLIGLAVPAFSASYTFDKIIDYADDYPGLLSRTFIQGPGEMPRTFYNLPPNKIVIDYNGPSVAWQVPTVGPARCSGENWEVQSTRLFIQNFR